MMQRPPARPASAHAGGDPPPAPVSAPRPCSGGSFPRTTVEGNAEAANGGAERAPPGSPSMRRGGRGRGRGRARVAAAGRGRGRGEQRASGSEQYKRRTIMARGGLRPITVAGRGGGAGRGTGGGGPAPNAVAGAPRDGSPNRVSSAPPVNAMAGRKPSPTPGHVVAPSRSLSGSLPAPSPALAAPPPTEAARPSPGTGTAGTLPPPGKVLRPGSVADAPPTAPLPSPIAVKKARPAPAPLPPPTTGASANQSSLKVVSAPPRRTSNPMLPVQPRKGSSGAGVTQGHMCAPPDVAPLPPPSSSKPRRPLNTPEPEPLCIPTVAVEEEDEELAATEEAKKERRRRKKKGSADDSETDKKKKKKKHSRSSSMDSSSLDALVSPRQDALKSKKSGRKSPKDLAKLGSGPESASSPSLPVESKAVKFGPPMDKKSRRAFTSTAGSKSTSALPVKPTPKKGTRDMRREFASKRMSTALVGSAIQLSFLMEQRPTIEDLERKNIFRPAAGVVSSDDALRSITWTSKVHVTEEWMDQSELFEDERVLHCLLVNKKCLAGGYHIEIGYSNIAPDSQHDLGILDSDQDICFFRTFLYNQVKYKHYVGSNDNGPIAVTIEASKGKKFQRAIVRTKKGDERLLVDCVAEDSQKLLRALRSRCPDLGGAKLGRVRPEETEEFSAALMSLEEKMMVKQYKFGVLYSHGDQRTDEDMLNNEHGSAAFDEFLSLLGQRIELMGWSKFRGGLNVRDGSTGTHSVYTEYRDFEIMFHVSTLLPFIPDDQQQLERKRHLGNDVIIIIFQEGDVLFDPTPIRSHFNHVFALVKPLTINGKRHYQVNFVSKPGVTPFHPFMPFPPVFEKGTDFRDFFLSKLINAERAAMRAPEFVGKHHRTREMLMEDMIQKIGGKRGKTFAL